MYGASAAPLPDAFGRRASPRRATATSRTRRSFDLAAEDELGVDERTARGLLRALEHAGYATATGGRPRRYQIGPRALALARQAALVDRARRNARASVDE